MERPVPTNTLRARLGVCIEQGLGLPGISLLSTRGLKKETAAIVVQMSWILAIAESSVWQQKSDANQSITGRTGQKLPRAPLRVRTE
jgi:hypothetical protein